MKEALEKYNHVLIITDEGNIEEAETKQRELQKEGRTVQLEVFANLNNKATLETMMSNQPLGSALIILGEVPLEIERLAASVGYLKDAIHLITSEELRVFCSKCHYINIVPNQGRLVCENCQQQLESSDHYSVYHRAYLAYPVFTKYDA